MFELIPVGTKFPFMKLKIPFVVFSVVTMAAAVYSIATRGFNFGVDFVGGIQMVMSLPTDSNPSAEKLRTTFDRLGVDGVTVQEFGSRFEKKEAEYNIHFAADFLDEQKVRSSLDQSFSKLNKGPHLIKGFRFVGLEKAYVTLSESVPLSELEKLVRQTSFGLMELTNVQVFGRESSNEYQLTFKSIQALVEREIAKDFVSPSGAQPIVHKIDFVGSKVGKDLKMSGLLSFFLTTLLIFFYIFVRFDLFYAPGVVVSLIHDVLITAGLVSWFQIEFDLTMVAALLTLAGYSINDTIIVYDRIRELAGSLRGKAFEEIVNLAINQTLARTIVTSGTVLFVAIALWVWGGTVIHGFATALLIGVVVGTYSSIFIASPLLLFTMWWKNAPRTNKRAAA